MFLFGALSSQFKRNVDYSFFSKNKQTFFLNEKVLRENFSVFLHTFGLYSCGAGLGLAALVYFTLFFLLVRGSKGEKGDLMSDPEFTLRDLKMKAENVWSEK